MVVAELLSFLVLMNPFAMFIYLGPVMEDLSGKDFRTVLFRATFLSYLIYAFFLVTGLFLFQQVFQISFEAFRIFGGIIIFSFAYLYILKGQRALIHLKENLDDLASEIALPFMVGAATISLVILISTSMPTTIGLAGIAVSLVVYDLIILALKAIRDGLEKKKKKVAFDKNMEILMRLNGFFLGAIGVDMIVTGIGRVFL